MRNEATLSSAGRLARLAGAILLLAALRAVAGCGSVGADGDIVGPDGDTDGDPPLSACQPACPYEEHQYCDEAIRVCRDIECVTCQQAADCPPGQTCLAVTFQEGSTGRLCSGACGSDDECPEGFACLPAAGRCYPRALCVLPSLAPGDFGDPCPFRGVNPESADCGGELVCLGSDPDPSLVCTVDADCRQGAGMGQTGDCVDGGCAISFCASRCGQERQCPEGSGARDVDDGTGGAACFCIPGGTPPGDALFGDPCPYAGINPESNACSADLYCLGIPGSEAYTCSTASECEAGGFKPNGYCSNGRCGASFCASACGTDGSCTAGGPQLVNGRCFCIPGLPAAGLSGFGDACPFSGGVHPEADTCRLGLDCLGVAPSADFSCSGTNDCLEAGIEGAWNPVCIEGRCGASFCSQPCGSSRACPVGSGPQDIGGSCFCIPGMVVGDAGPGEACPFSDINATADGCREGLVCLGADFGADAPTPVACDEDGDCLQGGIPQGYNPVCRQSGWCGASFCSGRCGAGNACARPFEPIDVGGECYCVPPSD